VEEAEKRRASEGMPYQGALYSTPSRASLAFEVRHEAHAVVRDAYVLRSP